MNSGSSFSSLSFQKSPLLGGPVMHISQFGINGSVNNFFNPMVRTRHMHRSCSGSQVDNLRRGYGYQRNSSELSRQLGGHPGMKSRFRHSADIEINPNKEVPGSTMSNNNNPHAFDPTTGFNKNENPRAGYEEGYGKLGEENLPHLIPIIENLNPTRNNWSSTNEGRTPNDTAEKDSNLVCSLTELNLSVYNMLNPPLKGDFRKIVGTWLQKSAA